MADSQLQELLTEHSHLVDLISLGSRQPLEPGTQHLIFCHLDTLWDLLYLDPENEGVETGFQCCLLHGLTGSSSQGFPQDPDVLLWVSTSLLSQVDQQSGTWAPIKTIESSVLNDSPRGQCRSQKSSILACLAGGLGHLP